MPKMFQKCHDHSFGDKSVFVSNENDKRHPLADMATNDDLYFVCLSVVKRCLIRSLAS